MLGLFKDERINKLKAELAHVYSELSKKTLDISDWKHTARHWKEKYEGKNAEFNTLVRMINDRGGQEFLDHGEIPWRRKQEPKKQFTDAQIKTLIVLCHPDKHGNGTHGKMAEDLFKTLNGMRK